LVYAPAKRFKDDVASGDRTRGGAQRHGVFGHLWNRFDFFFDSYPDGIEFDRGSVYYDVKSNPERHSKAYFNMAKMSGAIKENGTPSFQCFPIKSSYILSHYIIDTQILANQFYRFDKPTARSFASNIARKGLIWREIFDLDNHSFRE
jgi:hypothetical protein